LTLEQEYTSHNNAMLNFAVDTWTSPNNRVFLAITVHYAASAPDDPCQFLLDFVEVPCSHTGKMLAKVFEVVVKQFGISDKVCSVLYF
jgi:hypothetical protein